MSLFVVDVESDGPAPGLYSMVSFGIVRVDRDLETRFYGKTAPITDAYLPDALAVSGHSRQEHENFASPHAELSRMAAWIQKVNAPKTRITFVSDNPAFDWQFINWYAIRYLGSNPFGHTARRIGDFCGGLHKDWGASSNFKKLRKAAHTHNPVDDALGNAQALIALADSFGVRLPGVAVQSPSVQLEVGVGRAGTGSSQRR